MATTRATRIDENHHEGRLLQGKKLVAPAPPQRRAALGELGNRALSRTNSVLDTKNVKPKVDTRWASSKVVEVKTTKTSALRIGMQKSENAIATATAGAITKSTRVSKEITVATTKLTQTAKPMAVEKIFISGPKVDVKLKEREVRREKSGSLKREESHLTKNSITKLREVLTKDKKISSSKALKSSTSSSATQSTTSSRSLSPENKEIKDIDANDKMNPFLMSEYVQDIYTYLSSLETENSLRENFLDRQMEITPKMRQILVDWIIEVHDQFKCAIETYFMAIAIIDRFLQAVETISRNELQLVGVTALFIASKYEDLYPEEVANFVHVTDQTYTKSQILDMEKKILKALDFNLSLPLAIQFMRRFAKAANLNCDSTYVITKYLLQLVSTEYSFAHCKSSQMAAACIFVALKISPKNYNKSISQIWTPTLEYYSKYTVQELKPIAQQIVKLLKNAPSAKLKAAYVAYGSSKNMRISHSAEVNSASTLDMVYRSLGM